MPIKRSPFAQHSNMGTMTWGLALLSMSHSNFEQNFIVSRFQGVERAIMGKPELASLLLKSELDAICRADRAHVLAVTHKPVMEKQRAHALSHLLGELQPACALPALCSPWWRIHQTAPQPQPAGTWPAFEHGGATRLRAPPQKTNTQIIARPRSCSYKLKYSTTTACSAGP